jgi:transposase
MSKRKNYSAEEKVRIIRDYLENGISIGQLCEKYDLHPNIIYKWKKDLFEGALKTFSGEHKQKKPKENKRILQLETKLKARDSLISEIVSENVMLKKNISGEI